MKVHRLSSLAFCAAFAALSAPCILSQNIHRTYHDSLTVLTDTTVMFSYPTRSVKAIALETRCALPDADRFTPLQFFGIIWGNSDTVYSATLRPCDPMPDDVFDHRYIHFIINRHENGGVSTVHEDRLREGFAMDNFENTLGVEIDMKTKRATVYGGEKHPQELSSVPVNLTHVPMMGITTQGKAMVSFAVSEYTSSPGADLMTPWNLQDLKQKALNCDAPEGFYRYLDKNIDSNYARTGGEYTLALFDNGNGGYNLVYVDGAKTNSDLWRPGMLKAKLTPTIFENHYNLIWYDSACVPVSSESYAEINQNAIITINLPALKTSIRFALLPKDK